MNESTVNIGVEEGEGEGEGEGEEEGGKKREGSMYKSC